MFALLLLSSLAFAHEPLSIHRIFESPELDGGAPQGVKFSPNGERLSFLKPKETGLEVLDLWEYDLKTGRPKLLVDSSRLSEGPLSEAEKARRERMRVSKRGIVEYHWSNDATMLAFPAANDIYLYGLAEKKLRQLTKSEQDELDVKFSPKDSYLSFVREQNLFLVGLRDGKEHQVSTLGKGDVTCATAEFIAQEEMSRFTGYWISEDEEWIAYQVTDESMVKKVQRYEIDADKVTVKEQRYPEAGTANAQVKLAVVRLQDVLSGTPRPQWVDLGIGEHGYLARAQWTPQGKLAYQVQSRDQKTLELWHYDPKTQKSKRLICERDAHWVELFNDERYLKDGRFIWQTEASGFAHLDLYSADGKRLFALTGGDWVVDELNAVDEAQGLVYFTAGLPSPLEHNLYRVKLEKNAKPERLTTREGNNTVVMERSARFYTEIYSGLNQPPQVTLRSVDGKELAQVWANKIEKGHPFYPYAEHYVTPEFGSFKHEGTELYYQLYKPKYFNPAEKYPLVVMGYGGPTVQVVSKGWRGRNGHFANVLTQHGFVVASFDNRGSNRRGRKFANHLYHAMGTVEVEDQVAGVKFLLKQGYIEPNHVGFFGWSYGGYLSLMLAMKAPEVFAANVAVAPVTDFRLYDTHYTERYMGMPQEEKRAYDRADVLHFTYKLDTRLLVMHGMADDNVLFTNSTLLFKDLQQKDKVYESVTYPGAKHGIYGRENQIHVYRTIADFFRRNLMPQKAK